MNRPKPKMREFARQLIAYETRRGSSEAKSPAAFLVCAKLRPQLATLMGNGGFRALLSRALVLANADAVWLRPVQVKADGSLERMDERTGQSSAKEIAEGGEILVARLLGLLEDFIGEDLTVRLVRDVWPQLSTNEHEFDEGT